MPRTQRMIVDDQSTVYHVMSRTALDGFPLGDIEKEFMLDLIRIQVDGSFRIFPIKCQSLFLSRPPAHMFPSAGDSPGSTYPHTQLSAVCSTRERPADVVELFSGDGRELQL